MIFLYLKSTRFYRCAIIIGDLTEEGIKFYAFGIRKWREKYDRAKDKDKAINDFYYIEKKLKEFREKQ